MSSPWTYTNRKYMCTSFSLKVIKEFPSLKYFQISIKLAQLYFKKKNVTLTYVNPNISNAKQKKTET